MTPQEARSKMRHIIVDLEDIQAARLNGYQLPKIDEAIRALEAVVIHDSV